MICIICSHMIHKSLMSMIVAPKPHFLRLMMIQMIVQLHSKQELSAYPIYPQIIWWYNQGRNSSCCWHNRKNAPTVLHDFIPMSWFASTVSSSCFWNLFHLFPRHLTCWLLNCLHILGDLSFFSWTFILLFYYLKCNLSFVVTLWQLYPHSFPS